MRNALIMIIGLSFSNPASAAVAAFLRADPVRILIQGADSDAQRLYDALNVPAMEKPGTILEKQIQSPSGQLSISCRFAPLTTVVSCTLSIKRGSNFEVSEEKRQARLTTQEAADAQFLFERLAKSADGQVPTYVTEKQEFAIVSLTGQFELSYQYLAQ